MLRAAPVRVLDDRDVPEALALLARDPVANVFVAARVEAVGLDPWRLGAEVWGYSAGGRLVSLCYAGANLVPVEAPPEAVHLFAERARRQGRRCSSIVGPQSMVGQLWRQLEPAWGPARDVRPHQPLMQILAPSPVLPDPLVRLVRPDELDVLLPACIAMFTEEVGTSPIAGDGGALYRSRVSELVAARRAFARIERGRVIFKAELGAVTRKVAQVQGVWVDPRLRGRGLSVPAMASVVQATLTSVAPVVSLYVNSYNAAARACYDRVGFVQVGSFMSVLF